MNADKGTSVLASLTAKVMDTMESKQTAAKRTLTPVAAEVRTKMPDLPGDFLTDERMAMIARESRLHADYLMKVAEGIERQLGMADAPVEAAPLRLVGPAPVVAAPTAFELDLAAKAAAAQAATYKAEAIAIMATPVGEPVGWVCPEHLRVIDKVSTKSGRAFRGCPDCNLFER